MDSTIQSLLQDIKDDVNLNAIYEFVSEHLQHDPSHDMNHFIRVGLMSLEFAEGKCNKQHIIAAALLHDVVNLPKDHPDSKKASSLSADIVREFLPTLNFSVEEIEEIAGAVRDHSYSRGAVPETLLGKVIQDADRIEALGVLGMFRTISVGTQMGTMFYHPDDPWALDRDLDDRKYMMDHLFVKLFKLPNTMNTSIAKQWAEERCIFMIDMLKKLGLEIGHPYYSSTPQ
jgi:uncharacterized protein